MVMDVVQIVKSCNKSFWVKKIGLNETGVRPDYEKY